MGLTLPSYVVESLDYHKKQQAIITEDVPAIREVVKDIKLAYSYDPWLAIIRRQKEALDNLLQGKPLGHALEDMQANEEVGFLGAFHLKNLEALARHVDATMTLTEGEAQITNMHGLEGKLIEVSVRLSELFERIAKENPEFYQPIAVDKPDPTRHINPDSGRGIE